MPLHAATGNLKPALCEADSLRLGLACSCGGSLHHGEGHGLLWFGGDENLDEDTEDGVL